MKNYSVPSQSSLNSFSRVQPAGAYKTVAGVITGAGITRGCFGVADYLAKCIILIKNVGLGFYYQPTGGCNRFRDPFPGFSLPQNINETFFPIQQGITVYCSGGGVPGFIQKNYCCQFAWMIFDAPTFDITVLHPYFAPATKRISFYQGNYFLLDFTLHENYALDPGCTNPGYFESHHRIVSGVAMHVAPGFSSAIYAPPPINSPVNIYYYNHVIPSATWQYVGRAYTNSLGYFELDLDAIHFGSVAFGDFFGGTCIVNGSGFASGYQQAFTATPGPQYSQIPFDKMYPMILTG